jgi:hypothetical protein
MKKLALLLPFWPILFFFVALAFFGESSDFSVNKISSNFPFNPEWEVIGEENPSLKEIVSQSFHYLGNGAQSFAFVSEDGKYVLKFFKMKHLTPSFMAKIFPLKKYKEKDERHALHLKNTFAACKMAYEELKEETGLIYVHLNATQHLQKKVQLFDKALGSYRVDLDKTVFVLQKRAEMVYKRIGHMIKVGNIEGAKQSLQAVVNLVALRNSKGFTDIDTGISRNYGFIGNQPIHIDFLGLVKIDESNEVEKIETKMLGWIEKHYPGCWIQEESSG